MHTPIIDNAINMKTCGQIGRIVSEFFFFLGMMMDQGRSEDIILDWED